MTPHFQPTIAMRSLEESVRGTLEPALVQTVQCLPSIDVELATHLTIRFLRTALSPQ